MEQTPPQRVRSAVRGLGLPAEPLELAQQLRHLPGFVFLDSATAAPGERSYSLLAAYPTEILQGTRADWWKIETTLARHRSTKSIDAGGAFGALIGSFDYNGDFYFGVYPEVLLFHHQTGAWDVAGEPEWLDDRSLSLPPSGLLSFHPLVSEQTFVTAVQRAQEYIAAGDIYQVNLSHPFVAECFGDSFAFYERLRTVSPAPHAAYLSQGTRRILSSSPETFLTLDGPWVRSRPIKGTRPRFRDPQKDERSAYELLTSPKEVAELVMITDLLRNDLGCFCEYGSVTVTELLKLERFAQVFHLVSTVEGRLRAEVSHPGAVCSAFPGGSITGAPKKRAMEIIAELEAHPRGLFTGAIGYFAFNDASQFSIAIRTVEIQGARASFHVGAGIVADSVPAAEFQETLHKASGILLAAGGSHL